MRKLIIMASFFISTVCYSQTREEVLKFRHVKNNSDSALYIYMSFLSQCDSNDNNLYNFYCEEASEKIGDYYKAKKEYVKAIAYYDSANTNYQARYITCGNAYYISFIPRIYKTSLCYSELKNYKKALATLTPYIFESLGAEYFDSTMLVYYQSTLYHLYSIKDIRHELKSSIDNMEYNISYSWTKDSTTKNITVSCKVKIFDSELELAGYFSSLREKEELPYYHTKEHFIDIFKKTPIYFYLNEL